MNLIKQSYVISLLSIVLSFNCAESINRSGLLMNLVNVDLNGLNITSGCKADVQLLKIGLESNDVWAIKLLDASGHIGAGFVWGNNYWLGSKHACNRVRLPVPIVLSKLIPKNHMENLTDIQPPMDVTYRVAYLKHNSKWQMDINTFDKNIIHIGFCIPTTCDNSDIFKLTENMIIENKYPGHEYFDGRNIGAVKVKALELRDDFLQHPVVILFLCLLIVNISFVVMCSICHCKLRKSRSIIYKNNSNNNNNNNHHNGHVQQSNNKSKTSENKNSFTTNLVSIFSIMQNSNIIFSDALGADSIEAIHGIRALGMIWIITGHFFFYGPGTIDNLQIIFSYAEVWYYQPIFAVAMAVDSYFVISGLLLSYLYFQSEKKQKSGNPISTFCKSIINRYLRLTPTYAIVLLLTIVVAYMLEDKSAFWMVENIDTNCANYWWRNLLYINNLYPMSEMCMTWSWFLSADFQCFTITTILLIITTRYTKTGLSLFGLIFVFSSVLNGYYGYILSYSLSLDSQYKTIDYLYSPTTTRIGAYFVGVFAGWFLSHTNRKWTLKKRYLCILWNVGPLLNLTMIFGSTKKELSQIVAMFYTSLGKTTWGIGIAWMIIACATNNGGIMNKILCAKKLLPLSRMSYTAYLLNPLCIMMFTMLTETALHLDYTILVINSLGFVFLIFLLAYCLMLIFENPYVRLVKLFQEGF